MPAFVCCSLLGMACTVEPAEQVNISCGTGIPELDSSCISHRIRAGGGGGGPWVLLG